MAQASIYQAPAESLLSLRSTGSTKIVASLSPTSPTAPRPDTIRSTLKMSDRLTQLQEAADEVCSPQRPRTKNKPQTANPRPQLANQFIACFYYLERRHDLEPFGPNDKIPDLKPEQPKEGRTHDGHHEKPCSLTQAPVDSLPPDVFQAGMVELARDLILKEQQMEYLISNLPGLDNSEREQEQLIRDLEEELKVAEAQRLEAVKEKQEVLGKLNQVLRGIRRH